MAVEINEIKSVSKLKVYAHVFLSIPHKCGGNLDPAGERQTLVTIKKHYIEGSLLN